MGITLSTKVKGHSEALRPSHMLKTGWSRNMNRLKPQTDNRTIKLSQFNYNNLECFHYIVRGRTMRGLLCLNYFSPSAVFDYLYYLFHDGREKFIGIISKNSLGIKYQSRDIG